MSEKGSVFWVKQNFLKVALNNHQSKIILSLIGMGLTLIPIFFAIFMVTLFSIDIPYADDWGCIGFASQFFDGTLLINNFIQSSGHTWLVLPNILVTSLHIVTKGNMYAIYYTSFLFYLSSFILLIILARRSFIPSRFFWLIITPASWFFFNPLVISTLLWGTAIVYVIQLFFALLAILLLERSNGYDLFFWGAMSAAVFSTISFTVGLCLWPVLLIYVLIKKGKRWKIKAITWGIASICIYSLYILTRNFSHVHFYQLSNHLDFYISHPKLFLSIISVIGADIISFKLLYSVVGLSILIIFIYQIIINFKSLDLTHTAHWYCLICYALLAHFLLLIYETHSSVFDYSHPIRFYSVTIILTVVIYFITVICLKNSQNFFSKSDKSSSFHQGFIFLFVLVFMCSGLIINSVSGLYLAYDWNHLQTKNQEIAQNYFTCSDQEMSSIATNSEYVSGFRKAIQVADNHNLSIFRNGWQEKPNTRLHLPMGVTFLMDYFGDKYLRLS